MNDIFADVVNSFMVIYLDDILIYYNNMTEHEGHVCHVLQQLRNNQLHANLMKLSFHLNSAEYLGFIVSPGGISMDFMKIDAILTWPVRIAYLSHPKWWSSGETGEDCWKV